MKSNQEDQMNMFYEVKAVAEQWRPIWESNTVFNAAYTDFTSILSLIETNRDAQLAKTNGATSEKLLVTESLVDKTLYLCNRIQSYANTTKNVQLRAEVNFTAWNIKKSRDSHLSGICNIVIGCATEQLAELASYSVTDALVQELQQLLLQYSTIKTKPKSVRGEVKNATENLLVHFKDAITILNNRLDLDIEVFKVSNYDFYSQYHTARMINKTGGKTSLLVIRVVNSITKLPIENALCTVSLQSDTSIHVVKKSKKQGITHVPNLAEGVYTVKVEKIGMTTQEVSIVMEKGRSQTVFVAL